jgi:hypothetical protein
MGRTFLSLVLGIDRSHKFLVFIKRSGDAEDGTGTRKNEREIVRKKGKMENKRKHEKLIESKKK